MGGLADLQKIFCRRLPLSGGTDDAGFCRSELPMKWTWWFFETIPGMTGKETDFQTRIKRCKFSRCNKCPSGLEPEESIQKIQR